MPALSKLIIFYLKLFTTPNTFSAMNSNNNNQRRFHNTPPERSTSNNNMSPLIPQSQFNPISMQPNIPAAPQSNVSHLSDFRSGIYLSGQCHTHFGLESGGQWALILDPYINDITLSLLFTSGSSRH